MKNRLSLLLIGGLMLVFSSCQSEQKIENEEMIATAISEITDLGNFRKVDYETLGNSLIRLELFDSEMDDMDPELLGKQCASIIFNATDDTRAFDHVLVSLITTKTKRTVQLSPFQVNWEFSKKVTKNMSFQASEL